MAVFRGHRRRRRSGPGGRIDFKVVSNKEIDRLGNRLRAVDKKLPTKLRAELKKAARPAVLRVKREVRTMPVKGVRGGTKKHPHRPKQLRRTVARGVRIRSSTRRGIRIVTTMPEKEQAVLPRGLDSWTYRQGWRHPVFGDREKWVTTSGGSWFMEPLSEERAPMARRVRGVLDDAAGWVAGRKSL